MGEFQLAGILEQFLSPEQYAKMFNRERMAKALSLPLNFRVVMDDGTHVWLRSTRSFRRRLKNCWPPSTGRMPNESGFLSQLESRIKLNARKFPKSI